MKDWLKPRKSQYGDEVVTTSFLIFYYFFCQLHSLHLHTFNLCRSICGIYSTARSIHIQWVNGVWLRASKYVRWWSAHHRTLCRWFDYFLYHIITYSFIHSSNADKRNNNKNELLCIRNWNQMFQFHSPSSHQTHTHIHTQ